MQVTHVRKKRFLKVKIWRRDMTLLHKWKSERLQRHTGRAQRLQAGISCIDDGFAYL